SPAPGGPVASRAMPRRSLIVAVLALALAACGGDDQRASDTSTTAPVVSAPATTDPGALLPQECADEPDPSIYVEGAVPPVVPPCEGPGELVVHTLRDGTGDPAENGDTLYVDYTGMIIGSGEVFDTSYTRGMPLEFQLGRGGVIDGWDQG